MELSFRIVILIVATIFTGLSAGLCFTWTNTITPGIGRLSDLGYLQSFQQMNRAIINPIFLLVFFGPFLLNIVNIYLFKTAQSPFIWLLIIAGLLYFFGVVLVTIFGNVPLNEMLERTNLNLSSTIELQQLRANFELKWNQLHLIRTLTSLAAFILLLISLTQLKNIT